MNKRISIVQALCPVRHCILACAMEDADEGKEFLLEALTKLLAHGALNPHCGLCGAPRNTWTMEVGVTRYASMEEARPELKRLEAAQLELRAAMLASGRAYDAQQGKA